VQRKPRPWQYAASAGGKKQITERVVSEKYAFLLIQNCSIGKADTSWLSGW